MEAWQAILLGLVQGVTEFIPISSDGHLRLLEHFFGLSEPQTLFDVSLHAGTLLATIFLFRREIVDMLAGPGRAVRYLRQGRGFAAIAGDGGIRAAFFICVACVPTGLIGYYVGPLLEEQAASLAFLAAMFIVNGVVLLSSRLLFLPGGSRLNRGFKGLTWGDAVVVGCAQGLAVARGLSRSGSTIAAGLWMGMDRETAGRFSFLASVPAILGALVLAVHGDVGGEVLVDTPTVLLGAAVAFVTGMMCLRLLMVVLKRGVFHRFGWYTLLLGLALLIYVFYGQELGWTEVIGDGA